MSDLESIVVNKTVDARGSACPGPTLEAKKGIGAVPVNGILEIWASDPNTQKNLTVWSKKFGHEFLGVIKADGYDRIFIQRKK